MMRIIVDKQFDMRMFCINIWSFGQKHTSARKFCKIKNMACTDVSACLGLFLANKANERAIPNMSSSTCRKRAGEDATNWCRKAYKTELSPPVKEEAKGNHPKITARKSRTLLFQLMEQTYFNFIRCHGRKRHDIKISIGFLGRRWV